VVPFAPAAIKINFVFYSNSAHPTFCPFFAANWL
jgi:hypothetical protein